MEQNDDFLVQLNESQRQAVEYCDGASLVIAGAGSGKTRVLTFKVAYLLREGYQPWSILALTFTNKAAREMKERIELLVGDKRASYVNMGTFHSIFARILRKEADHIGYQPNYTIYDDSDSRTLIKNVIKELKLDVNVYKPAAVQNTISLAKNRLITAEMYAQDPEALQRDKDARMPDIHLIYSFYAHRCRLANAMDFDDLLLNTFLLFANHEEVRRKYVDHYAYVLVDEYQDTNYAQQQIIYQLTKERQRVCVVGDDAQSIYAFRGANIDNILNFQTLYDNTQLFKLERNYRSTQFIVQAANSLISHNQWQIPKEVFSQNAEGEKLKYFPLLSDKEEVVVVARHIQRIREEEKCNYSDFAILYRTHAQSRAFEEQLRREGIPYRIYGGLSFYQRKEIKDIIAYFRLVVNPDDEEAFRRIINYPSRGIGNVTIGKIADAARVNGMSLWAASENPAAAGIQLSRGAAEKLNSFHSLITSFIHRMDTDDVYTLGKDIIQLSGIAADLAGDMTAEGLSRKENVDELLNGMKDFVDTRKEEGNDEVSLADFLQEVSLLTDLESEDEEDEKEGKVSLMTVHGAKGLEFPTVFVVGLEENLFPSPMCTDNPRDLEEERRLLYVAITRAERHCILTSAQNRLRYGRPEFNPESRFIRDISSELLEVKRGRGVNSWRERERDSDRGRWWQNSRPVGSQFKADPKPRAGPPRTPEQPASPFSEEFEHLLHGKGGRLKRVNNQSSSTSSSSPAPSADGLREGCRVHHDRFGDGKVIKMEGSGENLKVTVKFDLLGTKILLAKFARLKVIG